MRHAAFACLALALASCSVPDSAEPNAPDVVWSGGVARVAQAPDGTILWATRYRGETVFFAGSGAKWQTSESCGKNCTRVEDHEVPSSVPMER